MAKTFIPYLGDIPWQTPLGEKQISLRQTLGQVAVNVRSLPDNPRSFATSPLRRLGCLSLLIVSSFNGVN